MEEDNIPIEDDNIPVITFEGSNFFIKNLRDGGSRLEIDLPKEVAPQLMATLNVINEDQKENGTAYSIKISGVSY